MSEILRLLSFAEKYSGGSMALATVVRTRGSTYRRPGARMLIHANGESIGAVSGGCLERDVVEHARGVIASGCARLLTYDTRLTLGCNGVVEILVERVPGPGGDVLGYLRRKMQAREPGILATHFVAQDGSTLGTYPLEEGEESRAWDIDGRGVLQAGRSAQRSYEEGRLEVFLGYVPPPIRLVVIGTGYDAIPLICLARGLGWQVTVVGYSGDSASFGKEEGVDEMLLSHPSEIVDHLFPDAFTAAVVMTHHFGRDLAFLHALLPVGLPYLGLLGPRKRREQLLAALADQGSVPDSSALSALHSPVGLDLGGEAPEEIALSILAEIRALLAGRTGEALRARKAGIHDETPWPKSGYDSRGTQMSTPCTSA